MLAVFIDQHTIVTSLAFSKAPCCVIARCARIVPHKLQLCSPNRRAAACGAARLASSTATFNGAEVFQALEGSQIILAHSLRCHLTAIIVYGLTIGDH